MNNKRLLIFVAVAAIALAAFAFVGSPYSQLDFAQAFQYSYGGGGGGGGNNQAVNLDDPTVGDAANATVDAPPGLRFLIGACPAYTAPNGDVYSAGSLTPGDQYPVNGFSADGNWVRITIGNASLWVEATCGQVIGATEGLAF